MKSYLKAYCLIIFGFLCLNVFSQMHHTFVHPGGRMYQFATDTMCVFGNATNQGLWGSNENGVVHFYGDTWTNASAATMPGSGRFVFQKPRPAPYSNNGPQRLNGGHNWSSVSGCSFPDVWLNNNNNLYLIGTDAKNRDTFNFINGHVIHDLHSYTVGNGNPGTILNYRETRFFVTNATGLDINKGFLARENLIGASNVVAFPVGVAVGDYTPGTLRNTGTGDVFSMRVFNNVYDGGYSGVFQNLRSVGKTWDIKENTAGGSNVNMVLQHNDPTEGNSYNIWDLTRFITHYCGVPNSSCWDTFSATGWDRPFWSKISTDATPGTITTGPAISGGMMLSRNNCTEFSPYTKTILSSSGDVQVLPITFSFANAKWIGNSAELNWAYLGAEKLSSFSIQRSIDKFQFTTVGNKPIKAGESNFQFLDLDAKLIGGSVYYYKINATAENGQEFSSKIFTLNADPTINSNKQQMQLFPNPAEEMVSVSVNNANSEPITVNLLNAQGKIVKYIYSGNSQSVNVKINLNQLTKGIYYVKLYSNSGSTILKLMKI